MTDVNEWAVLVAYIEGALDKVSGGTESGPKMRQQIFWLRGNIADRRAAIKRGERTEVAG